MQDMIPNDPMIANPESNDPTRKYVLFKAPANQGGSDSNPGTMAQPLATENEYWQRIAGMNNNRCWPWLRLLPGIHTDSLDACCPIPGAPGLNLQSPTSGMGSFPVIAGAWPGHPLEAQGYPAMRDSCIIKGASGKVAFSAIWDANYTTVWMTLDTGSRAAHFSNERGVISGGNHRILSCQFVYTAQGSGRVIGDGGLTFAAVGENKVGGIWCSTESGKIEYVPDVPITFEGDIKFYGAAAYVNNQSYARLPVVFNGKQFARGGKFVLKDLSGIETLGKCPKVMVNNVLVSDLNQFLPGDINGTVGNLSYAN